MLQPASDWEYRWKFSLLVLSQPAFGFAAYYLLSLDGPWYSPVFVPEIAAVGVCLAVLGMFLRIWGTAALSSNVMGSRNPDTETLISTGLYGVMRNPLYVASILVFAGYGAFFGWQVLLAMLIFHWVRYDRVARYEELHLRRRWGEQFDEYVLKVPRWLPTLRRSALQGPWVTAPALIGNGVFIGIAVGSVVALFTGRTLDLYICEISFGGAMIAWHYFIEGRVAGSTALAPIPEQRQTR